ncbi:MAG: carboxylesterase/lipase family protein [Acidimicrobiales bacterium]
MELATLETAYGTLRGSRLAADLVVFRGIPYAAPPTGNRRFRTAPPPKPWTGVREATCFAPMSIQAPPDVTTSVPGDPTDQSEDCLYLNIYTPACDDGRRPVMVWIHGGGFVSGSASSAIYLGDHLARKDVVLVTLNYRLGALGWLGHPALADPDHPEAGFANWGLHDQLAGLAWVKENVGAFGGDPARVTLFGESAGSMSVAALLATSAPGRLFDRAILQSGPPEALGSQTAARVAAALVEEVGLPEVTREGLISLPVAEILRAQQAVCSRYELLALPFQPVIDGGLLKDHPAATVARGSAAGLDVMVGTNRDEWLFWAVSNPRLSDIDDERLEEVVNRRFENAGLGAVLDSKATIETYRRERASRGEPTTPTDVYSAIVSDLVFRVPSMRLADALGGGPGRVFAYLFDWESPLFEGLLGSCHALELPFVFGTCANDFVALFCGGGDDAERLSNAMRAAWARFAATGSPACEEVGEWPQYDAARRSTKRLGKVIEMVDAPMEVERAWLDKALGDYGASESARAERVKIPGRRA